MMLHIVLHVLNHPEVVSRMGWLSHTEVKGCLESTPLKNGFSAVRKHES